jgi:hypothetical protein
MNDDQILALEASLDQLGEEDFQEYFEERDEAGDDDIRNWVMANPEEVRAAGATALAEFLDEFVLDVARRAVWVMTENAFVAKYQAYAPYWRDLISRDPVVSRVLDRTR